MIFSILPDDIVVPLMVTWLPPIGSCWPNLDSALCNTKARGHYLRILSSKAVVMDRTFSDHQMSKRSFLCWVIQRSVHLSHCVLEKSSDFVLLGRLNNKCVKFLTLFHHSNDAIVPTAAELNNYYRCVSLF